MTTSEWFLENEKQTLSPFAQLTSATKGRAKPEETSPVRTAYQRDRDRIIHSKSFRRLMHKTQVFLSPVDEHYRTRMTHTLEVTQIARIIARALRLNEDLTEAIALGHDLGHTPFGHAGEEALRSCYDKTFHHARQSLRVVDRIEGDGEGLNLTFEVRDGILNHSGKSVAATLEGRIVKFADRIAYINSDIDDAIRGGILSLSDIPADLLAILGEGYSERINRMVLSVVDGSTDRDEITMTEPVGEATERLRAFLTDRVYINSAAKVEEHKAKDLLVSLYGYYTERPDELPPLYRRLAETDGEKTAVADFISCMTDRYAVDLFRRLFVPDVWRGGAV